MNLDELDSYLTLHYSSSFVGAEGAAQFIAARVADLDGRTGFEVELVDPDGVFRTAIVSADATIEDLIRLMSTGY